MHIGSTKHFRILLRCLRGLENNVISELKSFGFKNESLIKNKGGITIVDGDAPKLGFLSYFSRIPSGVFIDAANPNVISKADVTDACMNIKWENYIRPNTSILVNSLMSATTATIQSKQYLSQLVKDGIVSYFNERLKMDPPIINYKSPNVNIHASVDSQSKGNISIDAIGLNLNCRSYRNKPGIVDINGPLASALLQDIGYIDCNSNELQINEFMQYLKTGNVTAINKIVSPRNSWKQNVLVDIFAGCGVMLIEAAMHAWRIAPGELIANFAWQHFDLGYDNNELLQALRLYSNKKKVVPQSEEYSYIKGTLIGIEKNWEKVESILVSAERARVLDALSISQANILKHGLQDVKDAIKSCRYMVAQLPKKIELDEMPNTSSSDATLSPERYQHLLTNLGKHKQRYMPDAASLIIAPNIIGSQCIEDTFGGCAKTTKSFTKGGMQYCAHIVS